jgi:hypothetical protein
MMQLQPIAGHDKSADDDLASMDHFAVLFAEGDEVVAVVFVEVGDIARLVGQLLGAMWRTSSTGALQRAQRVTKSSLWHLLRFFFWSFLSSLPPLVRLSRISAARRRKVSSIFQPIERIPRSDLELFVVDLVDFEEVTHFDEDQGVGAVVGGFRGSPRP